MEASIVGLLIMACAIHVACPGMSSWNGPVAGVVAAGDRCGIANPPSDCVRADSTVLRVAAIQLTDFADGVNRSASQETKERTAKAVRYLQQASALGVDVAVLPEMGLVQYSGPSLLAGTQSDMDVAEALIAGACKKYDIWAVIGLPHYYNPSRINSSLPLPSCCTTTKCWYNTGLVIDNTGAKTYRQAKMHSAGPDGQLGVWLDTFKVARNVTASMQICYDAYFPHMSLLPVLKGSRLIFDLSSERGYDADSYYQTIGALYQGRAQESGVHVIQANTGAAIKNDPNTVHAGTFAGSHGNSQIISTDGHILARASHTHEQIVYADIPIEVDAPARGGFAETNPVFQQWLRSGMNLIGQRMPISMHKTDDMAAIDDRLVSPLQQHPVIEWLSPATGPNETLWVSGGHLGFADATLCLSDAECIHYTAPSAHFDRWPSQMRLQVPGSWTTARYSLSLSQASADGSTRATNATVNAPDVHWWLSSELNASVHADGWVRVFGNSLALGSDTLDDAQPKGCVDPRSPRTGNRTALRLLLCCGGPDCAQIEISATSEDCHSAEFRVQASVVKTTVACTMLLKTGNLQVPLRGNLTLVPDAADERKRIRALHSNASDLRRILASKSHDSVVIMSGVYHMSNESLAVSAGMALLGPAELLFETTAWLPGNTCLLGQLGSEAPAWSLTNVTITIAANISCNTADGLDTPANAFVCMGGSGSAVLGSIIQTVGTPGRRFCHLFHASGASDLSITKSRFNLRMAISNRSLPRVLSVDNCSRILIEANTMYTDGEGFIISSSNRVHFTENVCNSSISDGRHGNTLGTYHPP